MTLLRYLPVTLGFATLLLVGGCSRENPAATPQSFNAPQAAAPAPLAPAPAPAEPVRATAPGTRRIETRRSVAVNDDRPRYVRTERSKKKSAAIIGGSAAAGAAIGALAGGGKGAAIGAIAGGAGGLIYDRKTANKTKRVD